MSIVEIGAGKWVQRNITTRSNKENRKNSWCRPTVNWALRSGAVSVVDLRYVRYRAFNNSNFFLKNVRF
jgi:hypothetical protein